MFLKLFIATIATITIVNAEPLYTQYQVHEDYIPILAFHTIGSTIGDTQITETNYRDQIDYLSNTYKCNWLTMDTLAKYIENGEKLPTKTCVLNFDDGSLVQYTKGLCTLNEHKVPATYYINPSEIEGSSWYMTWDNIDNLHNIGHDIQPHTRNHVYLPNLNYEDQETQILGSKTDLENRGYNVTTFAYPYGDFNDDTLDIVSQHFKLSRRVDQVPWKDIRTPTISFNDNWKMLLVYIETESYTSVEIEEMIKSTGWWQFEDNYKLINGSSDEVKSITTLIPTNTSYGVLKMTKKDNEISTQFITKYEASFTLDIFLSNSTINQVSVIIDGITYTPQPYHYTDENLMVEIIDSYTFYNFYINLDNLSSGIHTLNVINTENSDVFLDKFRLFSDVNQDFSDTTDMDNYKECNSLTDEYCNCDPIQNVIVTNSPTSSPITPLPTPSDLTSDPTCQYGILSTYGDTCCPLSCGQCGGNGCGNQPGGSESCCSANILLTDNYCDTNVAPCKMIITTPSPTPSPTINITYLSQEELEFDTETVGILTTECNNWYCGVYIKLDDCLSNQYKNLKTVSMKSYNTSYVETTQDINVDLWKYEPSNVIIYPLSISLTNNDGVVTELLNIITSPGSECTETNINIAGTSNMAISSSGCSNWYCGFYFKDYCSSNNHKLFTSVEIKVDDNYYSLSLDINSNLWQYNPTSIITYPITIKVIDQYGISTELENVITTSNFGCIEVDINSHGKTTALPTSSTLYPTELPTNNPTTSYPTKSPTELPTSNPTPPTKSPTELPTSNPTLSPTSYPTKSPTELPTSNPTSPSKSPTELPTSNPTLEPTLQPTFLPTKNPTLEPTKSPTLEPTKSPTKSPTLEPTKSPTLEPTKSPTKSPTTPLPTSPTSSPTNIITY
jgi:peptidoglycan/xylan/chitin deacetylase (PgdA/CDA1 family)